MENSKSGFIGNNNPIKPGLPKVLQRHIPINPERHHLQPLILPPPIYRTFDLFQHVYLLEIWAHMSFTKLKNVYSFPRPDVMKLANACGFGQKLGQNGTVSTVLDKNSADKNFRRTKLPKIGLGAENFVRRKFLSAENFVRRIFVR